MGQTNWKRIGFGLLGLGAVGIWAALRWGNRYLDQFENATSDELVSGDFARTPAGWRIHYTVQGQGSPVVMIHGFMDSHQAWRHNASVLAQTHRVYAVDALGFGLSERVLEPIYSLKQQARVLKQFFDVVGIEKAAVVGHSLGGALALQFAYDFPSQVHKLVLIAPATYIYANFRRYGSQFIPRRVSRGILGIWQKARGESPDRLRYAYGEPERMTTEGVELRNRMLRVRGTHDALVSMGRSKREADVPRELQNITVPTLLVWGKRDRVVPESHALQHLHTLPNARLEWIETAGHLPHEEQPASFNKIVQEFLEDES